MIGYLKSKRALIPILVIILLTSSFVFIDLKWWAPQEPINIITLIIFIILILIFEFLMVIFIYSYLEFSIINMRNHLIINALIVRKFCDLFIHFPLTIIFEEFLFRLYIFTFLYTFLGFIPALILSSLIYGIYHIHTWFEFNDKRITFSFIFISTILGLILGTLLYYFGILICILIHFLVVLGIFYFIKKKITEVNYN